jgi:hypothetical protein
MDILWGLWNGLTSWPLLLLHAFGQLEQYQVFNCSRNGGMYQLGFLLGAGSPFLGLLSRRRT